MLITLEILRQTMLKSVIFSILMLQCCVISGQQKVIIIDSGHGGKDTGAIGINDIQEKDVVMSIANEILRLNNNLEKPLDIYLTRYSDTLISLSDRTKLTKALKAGLFVSLHCNHSDNPDARGIEVYVAKAMSKYSDDTTWLAFQLQDDLNKSLGFESRGVKFANFQVLRESIGYCTSVLLELGFLSNKDESEFYEKPVNFTLVAKIVLQTVITETKNND